MGSHATHRGKTFLTEMGLEGFDRLLAARSSRPGGESPGLSLTGMVPVHFNPLSLVSVGIRLRTGER